MPEATVLELFHVWVNSGYNALPYPGGWLAQPYWVTHDFSILSSVQAYHERRAQQARARGGLPPSSPPEEPGPRTPSMEDLFAGG